MKKHLSLALISTLFIALPSIAIKSKESKVAKADSANYVLSYAMADFSDATYDSCWQTGTSSYAKMEHSGEYLSFTYDASHSFVYFTEENLPFNYSFSEKDAEYRIYITYHMSNTMPIHFFAISGGNWSLMQEGANSQEDVTLVYDYVPSVSQKYNLGLQYAGFGEYGTIYLKNVCVAKKTTVNSGEAIGELPTIPEKPGYASSWTIDGNELTSETIYNYNSDKLALAKYTSTATSYNVSYAQHDLGFEINDHFSNSLRPTSSNNELTITGTSAGQVYYTQIYHVEAGKTYFVCGDHQETNLSSFTFNFNLPGWLLIDTWNSFGTYTHFYKTYTPEVTGDLQFVIQCAWNGNGSSEVSSTIKNFYFGEIVQTPIDTPITYMPAAGEKDGLVFKGWKIDGNDLSLGMIYPYEEDKIAYPEYEKETYKLGFATYNYASSTEGGADNGKPITYTTDGSTLTLHTETFEGGPAYFLPSVNVVTGHKYLVTFDVTTNSYFTSINIGEDKTSGLIDTLNINEKYQASYVVEATSNMAGLMRLYFQVAWFNEAYAEAKFTNIYISDLADAISVSYNETIGELPTPESGEGKNCFWTLDGNPINSDSIYQFNCNRNAYLASEDIPYTLSYSGEGVDAESKTVYYGQAIGELPTHEALPGYEYQWMIDDEPVDENTIYNFTCNKEAVLTKTLITYYATFVADDVEIAKVSFNVETTSINEPEVPHKDNYRGYWESYSLGVGDIIIHAVYEELETHYVIFIAEGNEVARVSYTSDTQSITAPDVPTKTGYTGTWESYSLGDSDIVVNAIYTAKTYFVTFRVSDDTQVIYYNRIKFDQKIGDIMPKLPTVPEVEGQIGRWVLNGEEITLDTVWKIDGDATIYASYETIPDNIETKGCGGSLLTASILLSGLAITGLTALIIRKKDEE